jgi:hypothetical protein
MSRRPGRNWNDATAMALAGKADFQLTGDWAQTEFRRAKSCSPATTNPFHERSGAPCGRRSRAATGAGAAQRAGQRGPDPPL